MSFDSLKPQYDLNDFTVLFFEDHDGNGAYDPGTDLLLGIGTVMDPLAPDEEVLVPGLIDATLLFSGSPIHAWADSDDVIVESDETNNLYHSGMSCTPRRSDRTSAASPTRSSPTPQTGSPAHR